MTSSPASTRSEARWATPRTPSRRSWGPAVARVAEVLGTPLMPWQQQVADTALEIDEAGRPVYGTVVVSVPRQSGKTTLTRAVSIARCMARPDRRAWYSAQTRMAARDRFMDAVAILQRPGPLRRLVTIRLTNGSEGVTFANGSRWRLFAPQPESLHGETADLVVIDEAWAFDDARGTELLQAAVPTGSTRPDFQLWVISTAGDHTSTWLRGFVDAGRDAAAAGRTRGLAYFEWSAPGQDLDQVVAAHPAVGRTIDRSAVDTAAQVMPAGEFERAYGNRWTETTERFIPAAAWESCATDADPPAGPPAAVALDVSPDRSTASLSVAWTSDTNLPHIAVAVTGAGLDWVPAQAARLTKLYGCPLTYDRFGPAGALGDRLDVPTRPIGLRDVITAAQQLYDGVIAGTVAVRRDPALDAAAAAVATRDVGDGWTWTRRKSAGDITPLVAAGFALWSVTHRNPEPQLVI